MKVNDDLYVLELPVNLIFGPTVLNLSLILDEEHGPILVDTGVPGMLSAIDAALSEAGLGVKDIKRVILTHQDMDHVGSLADLVRESGAQVLAHEVEIPYIDGTRRPIKLPTPEQAEQMLAHASPEVRQTMSRPLQPVKVDEALHDGQVLDLAGGVRVVFTPGHTPGHVSLFLERTKTLIAGDALGAHGGRLVPPLAQATPDMPTALASLGKLAALNPETVVAYHGGVVTEDAAGQLRELADKSA